MSARTRDGGASAHQFTRFSGYGWPIKPNERFASPARVQFEIAYGSWRPELQERVHLIRDCANAAKAIAMLVALPLVAMTWQWGARMIGMDFRFGIRTLLAVPVLSCVRLSSMNTLGHSF